jgi:hypothetical protein
MNTQENKEQAAYKQRGHEDSLEQRNKEAKGQNIEPQPRNGIRSSLLTATRKTQILKRTIADNRPAII